MRNSDDRTPTTNPEAIVLRPSRPAGVPLESGLAFAIWAPADGGRLVLTTNAPLDSDALRAALGRLERVESRRLDAEVDDLVAQGLGLDP